MKTLRYLCLPLCAASLCVMADDEKQDAATPAPAAPDHGSTVVEIAATMERGYVRSVSNLGAGAVAMGLVVGPFSRNVINLYISKEEGASNWVKVHEQRMKWGENNFKFNAPKSARLKLFLRVGGTRSGGTDLGILQLTDSDTHFYKVAMTAEGCNITGKQGEAVASTPAAPAAGNAKTEAAEKDDAADKLKKLKALRDSGALTEEEYQEKRKKLVEQL